MRPRGKYPPMTAAERQAKCRAIKRGEYYNAVQLPCEQPPLSPPGQPVLIGRPPGKSKSSAELPPPATTPALPAPQPTAIEKSSSKPSIQLALPQNDGYADQVIASLTPALAKRLRTLIDKHEAGKSLTADELAEARELIDIAEYFILQRMRKQLAA